MCGPLTWVGMELAPASVELESPLPVLLHVEERMNW